MSSFQVTILGCGSATPTLYRQPSAQALVHHHHTYLIDCGEGTQNQLRRYNIRFKQINHIFISHLHGDHFFGLPGLLSTLQLQGRRDPLHLFGPYGLEEFLTLQFRISRTHLAFELLFHPIASHDLSLILDTPELEVFSFPVQHRIPCWGYLFREKPGLRKLVPSAVPEGVAGVQLLYLKQGKDILDEAGNVLARSQDCTLPPEPPKSYAYCTDTLFTPALATFFKGVDLLYHEATFMNDLAERAAETWHSTTAQAGQMAKLANAKKLVVGHFSSRYKETLHLEKEVQTIFPDAIAAEDGLKIDI